MNECKDYGGETINKPEDKQLSTVELSTDHKKCRATFIHIPVYNACNNVYRGRIIDVNIEDAKIEPEPLQFQDFCMNVNMELNENQFVFNWSNHPKMNNVTGAFVIIIVIIFMWYCISIKDYYNLLAYHIYFRSLFFNLLLYVASTVVGEISSMVCDMPPSVGMVLVGMALNNIGIFSSTHLNDHFYLFFFLCELIESVILIIGGLEINIFELRCTGFTVLKLAILPQIAEAVTVILVVHYVWPDISKIIYYHTLLLLLINIPGIHSVLFMTSLEKMKHLGYFDTNNIYAVLNAASTLIDMAAIILNYISVGCFGIYGYKINETTTSFKMYIHPETIIHVAKEISIDIVFGILWGLLIVLVASPNSPKQYNLEACRGDNVQEVKRQITSLRTTVKSVVLFFVGGILTVFIKILTTSVWSFSLSCGISALVAGNCWRWRIRKLYNTNVLTTTYNNGNEHQNQHHADAVLNVFKYIWKYLQPLFFVIIGSGFDLEYFYFWMLWFPPFVLFYLLIIRMLMTTFSVWESGFNHNELLFINIAGIPNATLMACLLTLFEMNHISYYRYVVDKDLIKLLFNFTIISSLMTTVLGSYAVLYFGPILLSTTVNNEYYNDEADN